MSKPQNNQPIDQNMTVNVNNDELVKFVDVYVKDNTTEKLNDLLNCITKCRILSPAVMNDKKQPAPCLIKNKDGDSYLPIYTNKEQIPEHVKSQGIMNMPYLTANRTAFVQKEKIKGIVINPFTHNLIFKMQLIERVEEVEKNKIVNGKKTMKLTPEQYVQFERRQFEVGFLPKKLYSEGQTFMDLLCDQKETYVDQLYEESYHEKRMYPYIDEDFSVMVMNISQEFLVIRLDMPNRDLASGLAFRVYFTWNSAERKAGYYRITQGKLKNEVILEEVTPELRLVSHGVAPAEGAELQQIIDLAEGTADQTS